MFTFFEKRFNISAELKACDNVLDISAAWTFLWVYQAIATVSVKQMHTVCFVYALSAGITAVKLLYKSDTYHNKPLSLCVKQSIIRMILCRFLLLSFRLRCHHFPCA